MFNGGDKLLLHDVLYAPDIRRSLISVLALLELGFRIEFVGKCVNLYLGTVLYGSGSLCNRFMVLDTISSSAYVSSSYDISSVDDEMVKWHARLCHVGQDRMNRLAREGLLGSLAKVDLPTCENCLAGKAT